MERVGLVALSIAVATMLLVGASYSAEWLAPYLENVSLRWPLIGLGALLPAAAMLLRRTHHSK
jgi:uncharacterized membrane protein YhaH (DUF805 family)